MAGADLLAAVERSPQAAAAHDRPAWVGLFTANGRIHDPVGSRPHVGHQQIGRFFDTFIGPRDITFHRDLDLVLGTVVLRDLELEVTMGSSVTMRIPAILRYDLHEANAQWRIAELQAFWELPAMMLQFLGTGPGAVRPALQLSRGLLANQGLRGTAGFMAGFRRAGARHKRLLEAFVCAAARGDESAARQAVAPSAAMTSGDNDPLGVAQLVELLRGARLTKMIGAGPTVVASLSSDRGRGIVFADAGRRAESIDRIRYFPA
jgi:transport factor 2 (NTF2)-like protein